MAAAGLLAVSLLTPLDALAAGLGKLTVFSALGQPLSAEIEIVSLQPGEEESLSARIAPNEAFRQASIEFNAALLDVRLTVDRQAGKTAVKLLPRWRPRPRCRRSRRHASRRRLTRSCWRRSRRSLPAPTRSRRAIRL